VDFSSRKNSTASAGFEPAILGTRGLHKRLSAENTPKSGLYLTFT
jgi:hypothetical protein